MTHTAFQGAGSKHASSLWGAAGWGGIEYVYILLECSYDPPPPQKATLDSMRTLLWFVSYQRLSPTFHFVYLSAAALGLLLYVPYTYNVPAFPVKK